MVLGFLLADTNPTAAGDFLPLAASCLTPLQGSQIHTLACLVSHTQTYTDEHMTDYKYTGQDWVYVQRGIHWGGHAVLISAPPPCAPSALFSVRGGGGVASVCRMLFMLLEHAIDASAPV